MEIQKEKKIGKDSAVYHKKKAQMRLKKARLRLTKK